MKCYKCGQGTIFAPICSMCWWKEQQEKRKAHIYYTDDTTGKRITNTEGGELSKEEEE